MLCHQPVAITWTGLAPGIILLVVMAFIMGYLAMLLVWLAEHCRVKCYYELLSLAFGKWGDWITQFSIITSGLGACIAYVVIIGDLALSIVSTAGSLTASIISNRQFLAAIICIFTVLPLVLRKSLNALRFTSFISCVFCVLFAISLAVYLNQLGPSGGLLAGRFSISFFRFFPVAAFAYSFHTAVLPIYIELKQHTPQRFLLCVVAAVTSCAALYVFVGVMGYVTFGASVAGDVLSSYPTNQLQSFNIIIQATFMSTIIFTYPIQFFVIRLSPGLSAYFRPSPEDEGSALRLLSLLMFAGTLLVGIFVTDVSIVFGFLGSICTALTTFILPSAAWLKLGDGNSRTNTICWVRRIRDDGARHCLHGLGSISLHSLSSSGFSTSG